jgi:tRNA A-37 threonylcarbamoyl transferase component Bud32
VRRRVGMIGEVFGNYRVIAKLGEGGMGAVYLAEHPNIGRKVAIKMIRPAFSDDPETLRRFVREARSTASLRHPALVDIMDYGVHEKTGSAYIIMEYLEGESLDARLEREGRLTPARAAAIARQIALGMAAAHRAGIIHRDLKPGNVHLISDPDRPGLDVVKVLDFGIVKLANNDTGAGPTTRTDVLLGTPRYMAPEQCRGGGLLDHRADIYSLGCLLYEALAGRPPFAYQWPGELIAAHLGEMPAPLRALEPGVPEGLESIVMRAIAKDPAQRQPTMSHVAQELEHFLGIDVSVPPVAVGPSVAPPVGAGAASLAERAVVAVGHQETAATTTASVVMRRRQGVARGHATAEGSDLSPAALPDHLRADPYARKRFAPSTTVRWMLIGATALAAASALIVAIATNDGNKSPVVAAAPAVLAAPGSTHMPSATAPSTAEPPTANATEPSAAPPSSAVEAPAAAEQNPISTSSAAGSAAATSTAPAAVPEAIARSIQIKITNPRPGLRVTVDGRSASLPMRLPRDQKSHVLAFTAPNFKPETKTIVADQDYALTLEYRPKLYVP